MHRRIEQEILAELALTLSRREERKLTRRILKTQRVLERHVDVRGWRAFLAFERLSGDREHRALLCAIRLAFRRGLCTSRDDLLGRR